jgi:glutamyl-tRNA synthetase/glutamyl-Q tRNA(Asp) synthetase
MIVSRFAPAPTGYLHLGHVVNALHVWGITRALGGRVLLRIEDHDRQRSREEFERAILDDLDWLGFAPDDPSTAEFRAGVCSGRQRDRQHVYQVALARLGDRVYACDCTRRAVRAAMEAARGPIEEDAELWYPGRCASRGLVWRPGCGLRVRLDATIERFVDLRHGLQEQRPFEQCGDLLLKDRDDNWSYQFAVVADDLAQGVNLVIRGDDLLASTGRQILLARMLGRDEPPHFLHHGLIMKTTTQKLSKADRDTSVRDLRAAGATPEELFGQALYAAELAERDVPISRGDAEAVIAARYADALTQVALATDG